MHKPEGEHTLSNRAIPKQGKGIKPRKTNLPISNSGINPRVVTIKYLNYNNIYYMCQ